MLAFRPSKPLSVGMEIEYQLVNADTLELADGIMPLLEFFPDNECVKPEFIQETVELASLPCEDIAQLEAHVHHMVGELVDAAARLGLRLCGAGTHPFSTRFAAVTPTPRYLEIEQKSGYLSHTRITYATHVHVGVADPDEMIRLTNELLAYLPIFVALSANSPFWHGCETGFDSYRHRALAATGNYGIPPAFEDWFGFQRFFEAARRAGMCREVKDFHWEVRPQPGFGTVELRTMDAVSSVDEAVGLAALTRALVAYLRETPPAERPPMLPRPLPWWAERENHFRASQSALDAQCLVDTDGHLRSVRAMAEAVFDAVAPSAHGLGEAHYLERARQRLARGPGANHQRAVLQRTDSLEAVVAALVDDLLDEQRPSRASRPS